MIKPLLGTAALCVRKNGENLYGLDPDTIYPFTVADESMKPTFWPTDEMAIEPVTTMSSGKVFVILTPQGHLQLRRLYAQADGSLVVATDTPEQDRFPCQVLSSDQARMILVVGRPRSVSSSAPFTDEGCEWREKWGYERHRHPCEDSETGAHRW